MRPGGQSLEPRGEGPARRSAAPAAERDPESKRDGAGEELGSIAGGAGACGGLGRGLRTSLTWRPSAYDPPGTHLPLRSHRLSKAGLGIPGDGRGFPGDWWAEDRGSGASVRQRKVRCHPNIRQGREINARSRHLNGFIDKSLACSLNRKCCDQDDVFLRPI